MFDFIFKENKTYYVIDTVLKHAISYELKLQPYSVIIECNDEIIQNLESINVSNFSSLLNKSPNTFCGKFSHWYNELDLLIYYYYFRFDWCMY